MGDLYAQLSSGAGVQFPRVVMNDGPLPPLNTGGYGSAFNTPDGIINQTKDLLSNLEPYSYGENAERLSTQTSYVNHPHRYQKIIPKIFIPSALGTPGTPDVALEHAIKEGDVVFALRMPKDMMLGPSEFCAARNLPASSLTPLVNLATVNYILYGLQVGRLSGLQHANRWNTYFLKLTQGKITAKTKLTREHVWNFIKTYIKPFGVMYGSDLQGGQHEGQYGPSNNPVDYVASFLIDGKCIKTNNLWRELNISCGDDLILLLQETNSYQKHITHVLTSGSRSFREERTSSEDAWFYLQPSIRTHKNWSSEHIHIGRSQFVFGAYTAGFGMGRVPWDARASIIGHGIQITFEPIFHDKEESLYTRKRKREVNACVFIKPKSTNAYHRLKTKSPRNKKSKPKKSQRPPLLLGKSRRHSTSLKTLQFPKLRARQQKVWPMMHVQRSLWLPVQPNRT